MTHDDALGYLLLRKTRYKVAKSTEGASPTLAAMRMDFEAALREAVAVVISGALARVAR